MKKTIEDIAEYVNSKKDRVVVYLKNDEIKCFAAFVEFVGWIDIDGELPTESFETFSENDIYAICENGKVTFRNINQYTEVYSTSSIHKFLRDRNVSLENMYYISALFWSRRYAEVTSNLKKYELHVERSLTSKKNVLNFGILAALIGAIVAFFFGKMIGS